MISGARVQIPPSPPKNDSPIGWVVFFIGRDLNPLSSPSGFAAQRRERVGTSCTKCRQALQIPPSPPKRKSCHASGRIFALYSSVFNLQFSLFIDSVRIQIPPQSSAAASAADAFFATYVYFELFSPNRFDFDVFYDMIIKRMNPPIITSGNRRKK